MNTKRALLIPSTRKKGRSGGLLSVDSDTQENSRLEHELKKANIVSIKVGLSRETASNYKKSVYKADSLNKMTKNPKFKSKFDCSHEENWDKEKNLFTRYIKDGERTTTTYMIEIVLEFKGQFFTITNQDPTEPYNHTRSILIKLTDPHIDTVEYERITGKEKKETGKEKKEKVKGFTNNRENSSYSTLDDILMLLNKKIHWCTDREIFR